MTDPLLPGLVQIHNLVFDCIIGILPQERVELQPLWLDLDLTIDFAPSAASESVADTVNYAAVSEQLEALAVSGQFQLVETFAVRACELLFAEHPLVQQIAITVKKPRAVAAAEHVGVFLQRTRPA